MHSGAGQPRVALAKLPVGVGGLLLVQGQWLPDAVGDSPVTQRCRGGRPAAWHAFQLLFNQAVTSSLR
jgi:hypothetical protein